MLEEDNKMNTNTKWSAKDVITTVLLSVLLIVIQLLINMVCMASHFVSMVLSVGITCFVCAPVYFLMVRRVHKRFVSLLYMTLLGVVFLIMGDWFLLPYFIVVGLVCEAILWRKGSYDAPWRITAAWTVYSGLYQGVNLLPILAFWETFASNALASGMTQEYIDSYLSYYTQPGWLAVILIITVACGFAGSLVGSRMMAKHFSKAGVL